MMSAGNRYPEYRYDGYRGRPLRDKATQDQRAAWQEGVDARADRQNAEASMPTEDQVVKAVYESGLHQYAQTGILYDEFKDGIEIERPSAYLMNFVRNLIGQ